MPIVMDFEAIRNKCVQTKKQQQNKNKSKLFSSPPSLNNNKQTRLVLETLL